MSTVIQPFKRSSEVTIGHAIDVIDDNVPTVVEPIQNKNRVMSHLVLKHECEDPYNSSNSAARELQVVLTTINDLVMCLESCSSLYHVISRSPVHLTPRKLQNFWIGSLPLSDRKLEKCVSLPNHSRNRTVWSEAHVHHCCGDGCSIGWASQLAPP